MENNSLHENIIRTELLENELDHLREKVEKLCDQIDRSLPLLQEINLRMHDDISRRGSLEYCITELRKSISEISIEQASNQKIISIHSVEISDLKEIVQNQKALLLATKLYSRFLIGLAGFIVLIISGWNGYHEYSARNEENYIKLEELGKSAMWSRLNIMLS